MSSNGNRPRNKAPGPQVVVQVDGGTITAPDEATARRAVARHRAQKEREERSRELWGAGGREGMQRLCARFGELAELEGAGVGEWDPLAVLAYACGPHSHGERLAALFVLRVWNATTDWNEIAHLPGDDDEPPLLEDGQTLEAFDLMEAWAVWDAEHRYAALTWLQDPFWP